MKPEAAIRALEELKAQAEQNWLALYPSGPQTAWQSKVKSVLERSLGKDSHILSAFSGVRYGLMALFGSETTADWHAAFRDGLDRAVGYIDAALYELRLMGGEGEVLEEHAFDRDLWEHVKGLVADEDWGKVASQVAIFVESHVRTWTGDPKSSKGEDLVGKGLWAHVLADESDFRLGARAGEREGWRFLGMGFAQALSNVDRHHVTKREDAKRYAVGVLGLGSLLLTQLRHEHGVILPAAVDEVS